MAALPVKGIADGDEIFPHDGALGVNVDAHDPSVVNVGGTYVCFTTTGNGFCDLRTSKDLKIWKIWGPILPEPPEWLRKQMPQTRSTWAPAALVVGKSLRVYYCASERFGQNSSAIGVAENTSFDPDKPQDGWHDLGKVIESKNAVDNFNAIDPDTFIDPTGRQWMVYGSYWSGLYMVEIDPKTGLRLDPNKSPVHVASNTAERGNPLEAPFLCYHHGYYYLFVSYGLAAQGVRSTYRLMVGRTKSLDEPFVGFDGRPMTEGGSAAVLKSSPPMYAPGGGNVFQDREGRWFLSYHFYDGRKFWHGDVWGRPQMQIRELLWGKDDWPLPGLPIQSADRKQKDIVGHWTYQVDFGQPRDVELKKDGTAVDGETQGKWQLDGDDLTIRWPKREAPNEFWEDHLKVAYGNTYYVGRNQGGLVIRGSRKAGS